MSKKKIIPRFQFRRPDATILYISSLFTNYSEKSLKQRGIKGLGFEYVTFDKEGVVYFDENDWQRSGRALLNFVIENPDRTLKLIQRCYSEGKEFLEFAKRTKKLKRSDLLNGWKVLQTRVAKWAFWVVFPQTVDSFLEDYLTKLVKSKINNIQEAEIIVSVLTKPDKSINSELELLALSKLAFRFDTLNISEQEKLTNKHLAKFGWLASRWWRYDEWSEKYLRRRLSKIKNSAGKYIKLVAQKKLEDRENFQKNIKKLSLNKTEKDYFKILQDLIYLRTYRTDILHHAGFLFKDFFEKTSQLLNIANSDLLLLGINEVIRGLKGSVSTPRLTLEIEKRKNLYWFYSVSNGRSAITYPKKVDSLERTKDLKGKTANPGKARGRVKVVITADDFSKVKRGDILVTTMTSPGFVQVMDKAAAIICDEGGVTSHASIIARELKKPCIIGTKIVTKVLHDGDLVEVDADKGVVRILKRK